MTKNPKAKRLKPYLQENEEIKWIDAPSKRMLSIELFFYLLIVLAGIVGLYFLFTFPFNGSLLIFIPIGYLFLYTLIFFHIRLNLNLLVAVYGITNERIIEYSGFFKSQVKEIKLEELADFKHYRSKLMFKHHDQNFKRKNISFVHLEEKETKEAYVILKDQAEKIKSYRLFQEKLKPVVDKYQLEEEVKVNRFRAFKLPEFSYHNVYKGTYNKEHFNIIWKGALIPQDLNLVLYCKNPGNYAFNISAEKDYNRDKPEEDIGDAKIDDSYVLETDNLNFLKQVINDKVRALLVQHDPEILFWIAFDFLDDKEEASKVRIELNEKAPKFKDDLNILDAHLIEESKIKEPEEIIEEKVIDPDLKSMLRIHYYEDFFDKKPNDIAKTFDRNLELLFEIASSIDAYYKRGK